MQQQPPPPDRMTPALSAPEPNRSSVDELPGAGLKAKWQSIDLPIKIGAIVSVLIVFGVFARYLLPAMLATMGIVAVIAVLFVPYWLPTLIAFFRGHPNKLVIGLVNFLFGWTFIGWFISLFWALSSTSGGNQSVIVNVSNSAVAGGAPMYQGQPVMGYGQPGQAPLGVNGGPQYRVGDTVNGHRFDGIRWIPESDSLQQSPPPPGQ